MFKDSFRTDEDQGLAVSMKQGDQQSLGLLYDKYSPALMGIISRIAGNAELAEEILQNSFVRIWNQIGSFNPSETSLFTWMMNMARHSAFEEIKAEHSKNPGVSDTVYKGIKKMPNEDLSYPGAIQKAAFDLIYYKGLNCKEAAASLNISVDDLRINIRAEIKKLKEIQVA